MGRPGFSVPLTDLLRLEVEVPPPAGTVLNLLENWIGDRTYDGASGTSQGAYQWVAPFENNFLKYDRRSSTAPVYPWSLVLSNQSTSSPGTYCQTEPLRCKPGQWVGVSWLLPWIASGAQYRVQIGFYSNGLLLAVTPNTTVSSGASTSARRSFVSNVAAPTGTTHVRFSFEARTTANAAWTATGSVLAFREVSIVAAATQAAATNPPLITDSVAWQDVLGPTHALECTREALDVGNLSATVLDSSLDPATTATIRPGRRLRLRGLINGSWRQLFVGNVDDPSTAYALRRTDSRRARIALSALDRVTKLAGVRRPYAPQSIFYLPATIEGAGVPWLIYGYDADGKPGGANTTAIHKDDQATALDQITLARDTGLDYLWVDRNGVLQAYDGLPDVTRYTLTEADYTDLEVGFNLAKCFNYVFVRLLRYNSSTQQSTEETVGPYFDQASIDDWGIRPVTLTIAGNPSTSQVGDIAAQVLAKNAQPTLTVASLRLPILNDTDLPLTLIDLYDRVRVVNTAAGVDVLLRVIGVTHRISQKTPGGQLVPVWTLDLDFEPEGSIATPTLQPGSS